MAAAPKYKSIERYLLAGLRELNLQWLELLGAHAENAPLCAEMCRANRDCREMTYVISQKSCWSLQRCPVDNMCHLGGEPESVPRMK